MKLKQGCVYFVKHKGLTPIKIGYSSNPNPSQRIESYKTCSPYGVDLLGFISVVDAKTLETNLHKKYKKNRINREWFNITVDNVREELLIHGEDELIDYLTKYTNRKIQIEPSITLNEKEILFFDNLILNKNYFSYDLINLFEKETLEKISAKKLMSQLKIYCKIRGFNIQQGKCYYTKRRFFQLN